MTKKTSGFIKLDHEMMRSAAWRALSPGETALLLYIWSKHNGKNNGEIGCGRREIQQRFGCNEHTALKWLHGLRDKGFIAITVRGSFNQKTSGGRTTRWRLTMEKCDGDAPTRDYLSWPTDGNNVIRMDKLRVL
jgi:DNA-binding MarR family transcriptional regulator